MEHLLNQMNKDSGRKNLMKVQKEMYNNEYLYLNKKKNIQVAAVVEKQSNLVLKFPLI